MLRNNTYRQRFLAALRLLALLAVLSQPSLYGQGNYIRVHTPRSPLPPQTALSLSNSRVQTTYYDAAGRAVQEVRHGASPGGADMADLREYDGMGRVSRQWQPLPLGSGGFVPAPAFSCSPYGQAFHITYGYDSLLGDRLVAETGVHTPGTTVRHGEVFNGGSGALRVLRFTVTGGTTVVNGGAYPAGSLSCYIVEDEDGLTSYTFKDSEGRVVLERRAGRNQTSGFLDTYMVYGIHGELLCVLPPMATDALADEGTYPLASTPALSGYAYFYQYDKRLRRCGVRLPGSDWHYTVYDGADRVVLRQKPSQRSRSEWSFLRYDGLGRPVVEGTLMSLCSRSILANRMDTLLVVEEYDGSGDDGYTRHTSLGIKEQVLRVYYYDNYDFLALPRFLPLSSASYSASYSHNRMTGEYVRALSGTIASVSCSSYDRRGRLTGTLRHDGASGLLVDETSAYDFNDHLECSTTIYTGGCFTRPFVETYRYLYDSEGRETSASLAVRQGSDIQSYPLRSCTYDSLCRPSCSGLFGGARTMAHHYHPDGKYAGMSTTGFSQKLLYDSEETCFGDIFLNGRISSIITTQGTDTIGKRFHIRYDDYGRYSESMAYDGRTGIHSLGIKESVGHDRMGNVKNLYRRIPQGEVNNLFFTYEGNHRKGGTDVGMNRVNASLYGYDRVTLPIDYPADSYAYDADGNETRDLPNGEEHVRHNLLNLPDSVSFSNGNILKFTYMADGRRVRTKSGTRQTGLSIPEDEALASYDPKTTSTETRCGRMILENGGPVFLEVPGGFLFFASQGLYTKVYVLEPFTYITDYQGSVRQVVRCSNGTVGQDIEYLPSGAVLKNSGYSLQPHRWCGKEEITLHVMS